MTETRHQRFEIDLDEIERQLRRSVGASAPVAPAKAPPVVAPTRAEPRLDPARPDPLAELARIVGQNDPFRNILGDADASAPKVAEQPARPAPSQPDDPVLTDEDRAVLGDRLGETPAFDPIADAYGDPANAFASDDFRPLKPRRSRARLAAALGLVVVASGVVAGAALWRSGTGSFSFSGPPPLITADTAPTKVAPQDPGGIDIPNQDRQILEKGAGDGGKARLVDRQEQPVDVREAARNLPAPPDLPPTPTPAPVPPAPAAVAAAPNAAPDAPPAELRGPQAAGNALSSVLGEPRRVRTVVVRPDGSSYDNPPSAPAQTASAQPSIPSFSSLPAPVAVPTIPIGPNGAPAPSAAAAAPAAAIPAAPSATPGGTTPAAAPAAVTVLPPQRPRGELRAASAAASATPTSTPGGAPARASGQPARDAQASGNAPLQLGRPADRGNARTAAAPQPAAPPDAGAEGETTTAAAAQPAPRRAAFSVQIASRTSEDEARQSYEQLSDRYATDLGGRPASIARAEVNGRSVYRVKVGPMTREAATTLCTRLKASGGACTVTAN
ncbi:MAG: SPOR domain-containing protein [Methylobacteriaceae bacterium]|nr:SPOR domain-containing protein [Methylobacteriaceae bacterium]